MYIIRKKIIKTENDTTVIEGWVRLKKCYTPDQLDHFMRGIAQRDLIDYEVVEYSHDPDFYPINSERIQEISGAKWLFSTKVT